MEETNKNKANFNESQEENEKIKGKFIKIKKETNKKNRQWLKVVLILLLVIVIFGGILVGKFVSDKLSKIKFKDLDENDLEINNNLYEEVKETTGLTQKEYDQVINIVLLRFRLKRHE